MDENSRLTDEQLVAIVCTEDQERYAELVKRYEAKLLRYALRFVHDEDRAQDAVQNAFIKAFRNLRGFNRKKKFSSWIYRIVHNETINEIKRNKKEVSLETTKAITINESSARPDDAIDAQQEIQMLKEVLDDIPLIYKTPLILFYLEEKKYEEISDILHIPIGTAGTRINRGKTILRNAYENKHKR